MKLYITYEFIPAHEKQNAVITASISQELVGQNRINIVAYGITKLEAKEHLINKVKQYLAIMKNNEDEVDL